MKVVMVIDNVLAKEYTCQDMMECLQVYAQWMYHFEEQLGLCYGVSLSNRVNCQKGYIQIVQDGFVF